MFAVAFAVVPLLAAADPGPADRYARPDLLAEAADLTAAPDRFRVLDIRPAADYSKGHVAGAVRAPLDVWDKAAKAGTADAGFWRKRLAGVGVDGTTPVVVYGDDVREAARAWWLLKAAGVPDVRLLNGGWRAYQSAGGPTTTEPTAATATEADWTPAPRLASKADVLGVVRAADGDVQVVDARSPGEFAGTKKLAERVGHVPGATHLEWSDTVDPETGKFLPPADLARLVAGKRIDLGKPCVTYCHGGGRAAVVAFALELLGADGVRNYYRSWGEWGNAADTPVEE